MKSKNISLHNVKFSELTLGQQDFDIWAQKYARCYQFVYGEDSAWQEGKICHRCSTPGNQQKWRLSQAPIICPRCQKPLNDFWPLPTILEELRADLQKRDAICILAYSGDQVIGGCLGFSAAPQELEDHLNEGVDKIVQVQDVARGLMTLCSTDRVAYQNEIFVAPDWQKLGVGRELFFRRHSFFLSRGLRITTLRTKTNPPSMSFRWFHDRWNFRIIASYPDSDKRVILGQICNKIPPR